MQNDVFKIKDLNVPTWIIGQEEEIIINGQFAGKSLVLKIWPEREEARVLNSIKLNSVVTKLMNSHCSKKRRTNHYQTK